MADDSAQPPPRVFPWGRLFVLVLIVAALGAIAFAGDLRNLSIDRVRGWVDGAGIYAPLVYLGIYVIGAILLAPGTLLSLAGALLFPLGTAIVLVWLGAMLGSTACFLLARYLGQGFVQRILGKRFGHLDARIEENGFRLMLFMRLAAFPPFNLLNYLSGLTRMRFRDYVAGTGLGILPLVVAFTTVVNRVGAQPSFAQLVRDPVLYASVAAVVLILWGARFVRRRTEGLVMEDHVATETDEAP